MRVGSRESRGNGWNGREKKDAIPNGIETQHLARQTFDFMVVLSGTIVYLYFLLILISFYSNGRKLADQITLIHPKVRKLREAIPFPQVLAKVPTTLTKPVDRPDQQPPSNLQRASSVSESN